jgi:hypothetical protein
VRTSIAGEIIVESAVIAWKLTPSSRPPCPTPDGSPLALEIACASGPSGRHAVLIASDWSTETAHDVVAEQVVAAFGGKPSPCVQIADVLPPARTWLELELRLSIPKLKKDGVQATAAPRSRCCTSASLPDAAAHVRSIRHLASVYAVDAEKLRWVVQCVASAYGFRHDTKFCYCPEPDEVRAVQQCVAPPSAVHQLWEAGLSPLGIRRIYAAAARREWEPLPKSVYEAVLLQRPDLDWLRRTLLTAQPAAESMEDAAALVQWLAETPTALDRKDPDARRKWLATCLPWHYILDLSQAGYSADDLSLITSATRLTSIGAAQILLRWIRAGLRPRVEDLMKMRELGGAYADEHVSAAVISRLRTMLDDDGIQLPDVVLGLLFVAAGSAVVAHAWVRAGVADPFVVAQLVADGETPRSWTRRSVRTA